MRRALCLFCCTMIAANAAARPNLLPNSSFEQGDAGWHLWRQRPAESSGGVAEQPTRWGQRAFKVVNRGSGGANLHSDPIPALAGMDCTLSVHARTRNAQRVRVALWAEDADGKVIDYDVPYGASVPGDQPAWARFKAIIRAPETCATLKAHLVCNGGTVWWDGVQIERSGDSSPYRDGPPFKPGGHRTKNMLANSGFEDGELDWSLWHQFPGRSSGGVEKSVGRKGSIAFHAVNPGGGGANLHSEPVPCEPSTVYTLSVYARVEKGVGVQVAGWALDSAQKTLSYAVGGAPP